MQESILTQLEDAKLQSEVVATAKTKAALCPMQALWIRKTREENPKMSWNAIARSFEESFRRHAENSKHTGERSGRLFVIPI